MLNLGIGNLSGLYRGLQFALDLLVDLRPNRGTLNSYTRAGTKLLPDHEGNHRERASGEAGFEGARVVKNLADSSEDLTAGSWNATGTANIDNANTVSFPNDDGSTLSMDVLAGIDLEGQEFVAAIDLSGSGTVSLEIGSGTGSFFRTDLVVALSSEVKRYTVALTYLSGATGLFVRLRRSSTTATEVTVNRTLLQDKSGASDPTIPDDYVSNDVLSAPYHGLGIDGVKSFTTENGNTVTDNVVTEATGTAIADSTLKGLDVREAKLNSLLWNKNYADAAWTLSGIPPAPNYNQIGIDGVANSACELEDDNAGAHAIYIQIFTVSNDGASHGRHIFVKQEDDETSFPEFALILTGGTAQQIHTQINKKTGVISNRIAVGTVGSYVTSFLRDGEKWWWLRQYADNNTSGNASLTYRDYPALSVVFGVPSVAATGTVIVDYPAVTLNSKTTGLPVETEGTAVLTVKDVLSYDPPPVLTGANVNNFIIPFEFTMPYDTAYIDGGHYLFEIRANSGVEDLFVFISAAGKIAARKTTGSTPYQITANDALTGGVAYKGLFSVDDVDGISLFIGGLKQTATNSNTSSLDFSVAPTKLFLGSTIFSASQLNSTLKMGKVQAGKFSDAYKAALTA